MAQGESELSEAYDAGRAAALAGEEAAPGCTTSAAGREWLRGYIDGARERAATADTARRD